LKITVYYPFHPLHGCELKVVCKPHGNNSNGLLTVVDPKGKHLKIPVWMVLPEAAQYKLSEQVKICTNALLALANFLESIQEL